MEFRDLKKQYRHLKPAIDLAMANTAASGAYIMGAPVKALEQELAGYVGVKHCLTCANGTDALTLALKAWGIGPGDAVFVPDFTFFASAEVVALEGATPVFVDVNEKTYNIDPDSLNQAISAVRAEGRLRPKAVIAVDLFGLPADFASLRAIATREKLFVLEDGAQGFGGSIGAQRACSFGDIATTSFFPAKPLGCYGDGGAVFTDNDEWAQLMESYRVHGKGESKYDNVRIGMNSRLDTLQAAILQVKLQAFESHELTDVNHAAEQYNRKLAGLSAWLSTPTIPQGFGSSRAQYTVLLDERVDRNNLQAGLKKQDIPTMVYYPTPMSRQTAFRNVKAYVSTPAACRLAQRVLSLPIHPYMTDADIELVCTKLSDILKH
ncbi:MAG: hypothetical protein AUK63_201 [bacterium P3]|nr:MAG: hypothetical protein AUK63_201 [bacterium P3]KWW42337.1 MAG: hypothetical protein F083_241 [bacterium F083]